MRSMHGGSLVSCTGSLTVVDLPFPAQQLEFTAHGIDETPNVEEMALF
ncbi:hypothetical protein [Streptomyces mirabilis]|nr:hypothetical protein [Streptomyces mirabilis]MCX4609408.1 hypothetical protein [Streptomyces mirabilis]